MGLFYSSAKNENNQNMPRQYKRPILMIDKQKNQQQFFQLSKKFRIIFKRTIQEGINFLKTQFVLKNIPLICSGSMFQQLFKKLQDQQQITKIKRIFIFCMNVQKYKPFLQNQLVKCVTNCYQQLYQKMESYHDDILGLPNYRNLYEQQEKSIQLHYSYYLTALSLPITDIEERTQLINKFMGDLNKYNLSTGKNQANFSYPIDPIDEDLIIRLYSGEYFYAYLNNLLKQQILKRIQNVHIVISDLYQILNKRSSYDYRSKMRQSICYRAAYLSPKQISNMQSLISKDIQFLGFLSTSKKFQAAKQFLYNDFSMMTIYIPQFFKQQESQNFDLRGGYYDIQSLSLIKQQAQILFNLKTIMTLYRLTSFYMKNEIINNIQLIYGLDQILRFIKKSKPNFVIHKLTRKQFNQLSNCKCNSIHLIGTVTKTIVCLSNMNVSLIKQNRQSFFVLNLSGNQIIGKVINYSQEVQQKIIQLNSKNITQINQSNILCQKCSIKVKCSLCYYQLCFCQLKIHDNTHLNSGIILIESDLPRFLSLDLNKSKIELYKNNIQIQKNIRFIGDALIKISDKDRLLEAEVWFESIISNTNKLQKLDYKKKFWLYFGKAQAIRQRKYIKDYNVTQTQYNNSIANYQKAYQIVRNLQNQYYLRSKALHSIGIVQDDLGNYKKALQIYNQAQEILSLKEQGNLTQEQRNEKISILNTVGFVENHLKKYKEASKTFQECIRLLKSQQNYSQKLLAQYLNNLTCNLNLQGQYQRAIKTGKQSYSIRLNLFGSLSQLTRRSLLNLQKAKKKIQQKNKE